MLDMPSEAAIHAEIPNAFICPAPAYSVSKEEIPSWVKPVSLPEESDEVFVLDDTQIDCESKTLYFHFARKIEHQDDAMDWGKLEISFSPFYQKLILHRCDVIRSGQRHNRLDQAKIYVLQRGSNLDQWILNDQLEALIFLDDVAEGDLVEYAYSLVGAPFDRWGFRWPLQMQKPIQKMVLRILKPEGRPFHTAHCNTPKEMQILETNEEVEIVIEPCPGFKRERDQPPGSATAPYLEFTEFDSWSEVLKDELPFYHLDPAFALNPEAIDLVRSWEQNSQDSEEAALKALRFVQDEIRYLGLFKGDEGWNPANPAETLRRRYGDCKAKTELFRAFLQLLNIPSAPVLVHTSKQGGIETYLSQSIFNHVIARIDLPDGPVYVDPTAHLQGGALCESYLSYGKGLAISEETKGLSTIPELRPEIDIEKTTSFSFGEDGVTLTYSAQFYGEFANNLRQRLAIRGKKKCGKAAKKSYAEYYGSVDLVSYDTLDDRDANRIQVDCTLHLEDPWLQDEDEENYFFYRAGCLYYFQQEFDPERKTALCLPHPYRLKESVVLSSGGMETYPVEIEHPAFDFSCTATSERETVFELDGKLNRLPPEDLEEYATELFKGQYSSFAIVYEHTKKARYALKVARMLGKP